MTENSRARATRGIGRRGLVWLVALAAVTVAGCSSSAGSTAVRAASDAPATSISTPAPTMAPTPIPAAMQDSAPTVTVTVAPPPVPTTTVVMQSAANGPATFRSPSGNINCTLTTPGGDIAARCEVVDHTWVAPPPPDCHLDSGDRFYLTQGGSALVGCYGQEFGPAPQQTLGYDQSLSFGTITCVSEYTGVTCTDSSTGHYFRVAREVYELG